jgi:putative ABC transport system substrate-binding protein
MRRRAFITLLGGAAAWPLGALAQQPGKLPFIGVLVSASPPHPFADAFWRGLHAFGYSEGQNIKVEFRYTEGRASPPVHFNLPESLRPRLGTNRGQTPEARV